MGDWFVIVASVLSAVFAAGGAYVAVRLELRFLWRDLERLGQRIDALERVRSLKRRWNDQPGAGPRS